MERTRGELFSSRGYSEKYGCCIGSVQSNDGGTSRGLDSLRIYKDIAKFSPCEGSESRLREPKAPEHARRYHDEPYSVHRCLSVVIHFFPPTRSREGVISCESEYHSRGIDSLSSTGDILQGIENRLAQLIHMLGIKHLPGPQ